jgi:hypothetical protein
MGRCFLYSPPKSYIRQTFDFIYIDFTLLEETMSERSNSKCGKRKRATCRPDNERNHLEPARKKRKKIISATSEGGRVRDTKRKPLGTSLWRTYSVSRVDSICAQGRIGNMSFLVTVDTGASVAIVRPDIAAGLHQKNLIRPCFLKTASRETQPMKKRALMEMTLGQVPIRIWALLGVVIMCS